MLAGLEFFDWLGACRHRQGEGQDKEEVGLAAAADVVAGVGGVEGSSAASSAFAAVVVEAELSALDERIADYRSAHGIS